MERRNEVRAPKRRVRFEYDPDPDFSWLAQDQYDPRSANYEPVYPSLEDMRAGKNAYDGDWYRNPQNHVALEAICEEQCPHCGTWIVTDSLAGIGFLITSAYQTGVFERSDELTESYQRQIAKEMLEGENA